MVNKDKRNEENDNDDASEVDEETMKEKSEPPIDKIVKPSDMKKDETTVEKKEEEAEPIDYVDVEFTADLKNLVKNIKIFSKPCEFLTIVLENKKMSFIGSSSTGKLHIKKEIDAAEDVEGEIPVTNIKEFLLYLDEVKGSDSVKIHFDLKDIILNDGKAYIPVVVGEKKYTKMIKNSKRIWSKNIVDGEKISSKKKGGQSFDYKNVITIKTKTLYDLVGNSKGLGSNFHAFFLKQEEDCDYKHMKRIDDLAKKRGVTKHIELEKKSIEEDFTIVFDAYLLDLIDAIPGDTISMKFLDEKSPVIFHDSATNFFAMIYPVSSVPEKKK